MAKYVREIMTKKLVIANLDDSVIHALKLMRENKVHSILIPPARGGKSWWIFTETDFLLAVDSGEDPGNIPIGNYASPVRHLARPEWEYSRALQEMINAGIKHLPVIDNDNNVIGVISSTDMLNHF